MKNKIKDTFSNIDNEATKQSYINKIHIIFNASLQAGNFEKVCKSLDASIDCLLDLFDDSCPVSDHSQS